MECDIESKAFDKSKKAPVTMFFDDIISNFFQCKTKDHL